MSRTAKLLIVSSVLVWLLGWGRVLWQALTKVSPARLVKYVAGDGGSWAGAGFPHTTSPAFVDGDQIWKWGMYGKDRGGVQSGFLRFDLERGVAQLRWPFPGKSRHQAVVLAVARHQDGRIAVVWRAGKALKVSLLAPHGGVTNWPDLPPATGLARTGVRGVAWVQGGLEVAQGVWKERAVRIHRASGPEGRWTTRRVPWPASIPEGAALDLAYRTRQGWAAVVSTGLPADTTKPDQVFSKRVFRLLEGSGEARDLGTVRVKAYWDWLEGSPGNLLTGRMDYGGLHLLRQDKLVPMRPGPLAAQLKETKTDLYDRTYVLGPNRMQRITRWRGREPRLVLQYPRAAYRFSYRRDAGARRKRLLVFVQRDQRSATQGVVESFRFRSRPLLAPAQGGGHWLLGTFGYYVRLGADLRRADAMGFFSRLSHRIADFGSRKAQYDDFLYELPWLKKAAMPVVLAGLPVLWILCGALSYLSRRRRGGAARRASLLVPGSIAYLVVAAGYAYWFWLVCVDV